MARKKEAGLKEFSGGCLCGRIRFTVRGMPEQPHLCSCRQCQRWSGAPLVAWVDFPIASLLWNGPEGEPAYFQSSSATKRGFCPHCGGTLCALDQGAASICLTSTSFDDPSPFVPLFQSFPEQEPTWLATFLRPRKA
jgi:hypothetical protein